MTEIPPAKSADPVVAALREQAIASTGGGLILLLGGVLVSGVTVWMVVFVLWLITGLPGLDFRGWGFVVAILLTAAAIIWLRIRPTWTAGQAFTYVEPRAEWSGFGTYDGTVMPLGMAFDGALLGPRMVWGGIEQVRNREPASRDVFFDRCALLLRQLAKAGEAVRLPVVQIGEDETKEKLRPVTAYLDRLEWIGQSSDGERLWLSSKAKMELPRLGVPISVPGEE